MAEFCGAAFPRAAVGVLHGHLSTIYLRRLASRPCRVAVETLRGKTCPDSFLALRCLLERCHAAAKVLAASGVVKFINA